MCDVKQQQIFFKISSSKNEVWAFPLGHESANKKDCKPHNKEQRARLSPLASINNKLFFLAAVMESICSIRAEAAEIGGISSFPQDSSLPGYESKSIDPFGAGSQSMGKNTMAKSKSLE